MQSNLRSKNLFYPTDLSKIGPITRAKQMRLLKGYALLALIGFCFVFLGPSVNWQTFGLGLVLPGLGFVPAVLTGWDIGALMMLFASVAAFGLALVIWFATGSVILPCVTWFGLALLSTLMTPSGQTSWALSVPAIGFVLISAYSAFHKRQLPAKREELNRALSTYQQTQASDVSKPDGLTDEDLACIRLLLDRALQPVADFNGFDVLDQFQTAALRYQLNFISYALSMVQMTQMPAFAGYMASAQSNLNAKQTDPKVWGYWKLENSWGNFDTNGDPFARDNIMYSGFVAAQLLYQQKAVSYPLDDDAMALTCTSKDGQVFSYTIHEIIEGLVDQYKQAGYGLLPCEPNWVFPLCNAITVTAIRAYDATYETDHWDSIAPAFRAHLEAEFIDSRGQFVPFRSSYTGLAAPAIGGAVMQSFPCLFLNAVFPDLAKRQWAVMQIARAGRDWRKVIWPVDVGNYMFSRAAGYTATAAAALEMGDGKASEEIKNALAQELPEHTLDGIAHRPKASIWAHANDMFARVARTDGLRELVTSPVQAQTSYLKSVPYPDVLVAKAVCDDGVLTCVLVPSKPETTALFTIAGLVPNTTYQVSGLEQNMCRSDPNGEAVLTAQLAGRATISVRPLEGGAQ